MDIKSKNKISVSILDGTEFKEIYETQNNITINMLHLIGAAHTSGISKFDAFNFNEINPYDNIGVFEDVTKNIGEELKDKDVFNVNKTENENETIFTLKLQFVRVKTQRDFYNSGRVISDKWEIGFYTRPTYNNSAKTTKLNEFIIPEELKNLPINSVVKISYNLEVKIPKLTGIMEYNGKQINYTIKLIDQTNNLIGRNLLINDKPLDFNLTYEFDTETQLTALEYNDEYIKTNKNSFTFDKIIKNVRLLNKNKEFSGYITCSIEFSEPITLGHYSEEYVKEMIDFTDLYYTMDGLL